MENNDKKNTNPNNSQLTNQSGIASAARRRRRNRSDTYDLPNTYEQLAEIYREIAENDKRTVQPDTHHPVKANTVYSCTNESGNSLKNVKTFDNTPNDNQNAETSFDKSQISIFECTDLSSPTLIRKTHHRAEIHHFTNRSNPSINDNVCVSDDSPNSDDCDKFVTLFSRNNKKYFTAKSQSSNIDSSLESRSPVRSDGRDPQICGENKENVNVQKRIIDEQVYELKENAEKLLKDIICSQPQSCVNEQKLPKLKLTDVTTSSESLSNHILSTVVEVCENTSDDSIKSLHSKEYKITLSKMNELTKDNYPKPLQISVNKWMLDAENVEKDERLKMDSFYTFEHGYNFDETFKVPHSRLHTNPIDPLKFVRSGNSTGDCTNYRRRGSFQCTSNFEDCNYRGNLCAGDNLPEQSASQRLYQKSNVLLRSAPWELYQRSVLTQDIDDLEISMSTEDSKKNTCKKWFGCLLCTCEK